jgi:D-alanyl-D-alanine carboxypeptidase (penicillin-binding protein 5/6)
VRHLALLFVFVNLAAKPLQVDVSAQSALLVNANTDKVLFEKNADVPMYPASTTKLATALYILDQKDLPLDRICTVSKEALKIKPKNAGKNVPAYWDEVDGSKMGLVHKEELPVMALLQAMMHVSGNDAANVLAETASATISQFIEELNEYAQSLGCTNTRFKNPHGLHHEEHITTARDMYLMTKKALSNTTLREILQMSSFKKPKTNKQEAKTMTSSNALIKKGKYFYPKAIGGKTGNHKAAERTFVAAAEQDGRLLIAVLFKCPKREDCFEDAIRLFETAFNETKDSRFLFGPRHFFTRHLEGAKDPLQASLKQDLNVEYFPSEDPLFRAYVQWDQCDLPIQKGQKVGTIQVEDEHKRLLQVGELFAKEDVRETFAHLILRPFRALFSSGK